MSAPEAQQEGRRADASPAREATLRVTAGFGLVEDAFHVLIAAALAVGGAVLFGDAVVAFVGSLRDGDPPATAVLDLLDRVLLVFILSELIFTLREILVRRRILAVPFLVVGIVSAIRRVLVVGAESSDALGTPEFPSRMLELGVLFGGVLVLAVAIRILGNAGVGEEAPDAAAEVAADEDADPAA